MHTTGRPRIPEGQLTRHELQVVTELARGGGHRQIGIRLGLTTTAVSTTLHRAARRLNAQGPAHLVARAIGLGLLPASIAAPPGTPPRLPTGPIQVMPYLVIQRYRTDHGGWAWCMRCWGHGGCDGELALDLSSRQYAESKARDHLVAAHPDALTTSQEQPS